MTKDRLKSYSYSSLKEMARKEGIINYQNLPLEKLVEAVIEALEENRNDRIISNSIIIRGEEKKFDIFRDEEIESQDINEYSIPESYNETKIHIMLVEPLLAYAYWDLCEKDRLVYSNTVKQGKLMLRVHEKSNEDRIEDENIPDFFDIPVRLKDENWYINLPSHNSTYYIELILYMYGEERILCSSNKITGPPRTMEDIKTCQDCLSEDFLVLSGFYDFTDEPSDNSIPQRIISFLDNKYLIDTEN
ncbi:MAG: DUF4912 domain-containing protein [Spirochaetales bacterium]|nr:DUF4912 domain-containing protein [Spirochaetales bacterium]